MRSLDRPLTEMSITTQFDASAADVFRAFAQPRLMAKWMWAGLGSNHRARADVRVGGSYACTMTEAEAGQWDSTAWGFYGVYVVVEPPHRLVHTLHWDAPVDYNLDGTRVLDEVIDLTFTEVDGTTEVRWIHRGMPDLPGVVGGHRQGTEAALRLLGRVLAAERSGPM